jgi:TonB-linked SusC/RagA family outer membrane protein
MKRKLLAFLLLGMFAITSAIAQNKTITGRVVGADDGLPLPGVSVRAGSAGTTTGSDGNYSLSVPTATTTITFTYIGYKTQIATIGASVVVNAKLVIDSQQLAEVVVQVPYGSISKKAFTGAEATVTSAQIQKSQVTSVSRVLEGLIPGIQTSNGGGTPGSGAAIRIRGFGSINASSSPLYVLDGVPFDGTISSISTDDIETVTVLKDAAASALYGARAANGVIMITTKAGQKGTSKIAVNLRSGLSERGIPEYERVGPQDYMELMWEATRNANLASRNPATGANFTRAEAGVAASAILTTANGLGYNPFSVKGSGLVDASTGKLNPSAALQYQDSWSDALFQSANRNDLNLNISGGADKSDYLLSIGYIQEDGIAKFSDYDRLNARLKVNSAVRPWLNAGLNIGTTFSNSTGDFAAGTATSNPFYFSRYMGPIYPVYERDASGNFVIDPITNQNKLDWGVATQMGARPYAANSNLVGTLALDERSTRRSEGTANTFLEVKFLKDFSFKTSLGGNFYNGLGTTYQNSLFGDAVNVTGRSTKADTRNISYTFNQVLSYNKKIGNHGFNALAGHENYSFEGRFMSATRTGFPFPGVVDLAPAAVLSAATSQTDEHKIESYFSQLNYNFKGKYLLSGSFRTDGSSRFFVDNRWGNFWSVGGGYRISEEKFFKKFTWVNELKLRGSYGQQGNEDTGDYYSWQGLYSLGWNNVNAPGATISSIANPELEWEKNVSFNVGADFRLFDKLDGTIEYYERTSQDLLFSVPLPLSTGLSSILRNVGAMKNSGVELQLGYNAIRKTNFDYRIDVNLSKFKNEITKLPQKEIISGTKKLSVGNDIYAFWLREYAGVDPANGDALYYQDIKDASGNVTGRTTVNNINNATYYYRGSAIPDLIGGVTNSIRYKNFDFSALVTFQLGGEFYDGNYSTLMARGTYGQALSVNMLRRWQNPGDITDVPRLQRGVANQDGTSTRFLYDASYLTLKNINLGYTIPKSLVSKYGINSFRAFVSVDNAITATKRLGMDPQRTFNGTSDFTYPIFRTFTFGLNVNL